MIGWLVLREQVSSFVRTMQLFARPWLLLDDIFAPPRMNITIIAVDTSLIYLCWSFHLDRSLLDDIFAPPRIDITCITWQSWVGSDQPDKWWKLYYIEGEAVEKMKNGQSWQITNISITILFSSGRPRPYGWKIDKVCCQKPGRGNGEIKSGLY